MEITSHVYRISASSRGRDFFGEIFFSGIRNKTEVVARFFCVFYEKLQRVKIIFCPVLSSSWLSFLFLFPLTFSGYLRSIFHTVDRKCTPLFYNSTYMFFLQATQNYEQNNSNVSHPFTVSATNNHLS